MIIFARSRGSWKTTEAINRAWLTPIVCYSKQQAHNIREQAKIMWKYVVVYDISTYMSLKTKPDKIIIDDFNLVLKKLFEAHEIEMFWSVWVNKKTIFDIDWITQGERTEIISRVKWDNFYLWL